jgi:hypothetical protein
MAVSASNLLTFCAVSLVAAAHALAQQDVKRTVQLPPPVIGPVDPGVKAAEKAECMSTDAAAKKACWAMITASYQYWESSYRHRKESFDWSLAASKIIFGVVLLLVLAGLIFAATQFWIAFSASRQPWDQPVKSMEATATAYGHRDRVPMEVEMEISPRGLKVNSSVLGVIVLLISMAFFYLYARYVYPIQDVRSNAVEVSQGTPSQ